MILKIEIANNKVIYTSVATATKMKRSSSEADLIGNAKRRKGDNGSRIIAPEDSISITAEVSMTTLSSSPIAMSDTAFVIPQKIISTSLGATETAHHSYSPSTSPVQENSSSSSSDEDESERDDDIQDITESSSSDGGSSHEDKELGGKSNNEEDDGELPNNNPVRRNLRVVHDDKHQVDWAQMNAVANLQIGYYKKKTTVTSTRNFNPRIGRNAAISRKMM